MRSPDGLADRRETVPTKEIHEPREDPPDELRALEDKCRMNLYQAGTGADLSVSVLGTCDPAHADQWQTPLCQGVYLREKRSRPSEQGAPAEPARFMSVAATQPRRALHRRI